MVNVNIPYPQPGRGYINKSINKNDNLSVFCMRKVGVHSSYVVVLYKEGRKKQKKGRRKEGKKEGKGRGSCRKEEKRKGGRRNKKMEKKERLGKREKNK